MRSTCEFFSPSAETKVTDLARKYFNTVRDAVQFLDIEFQGNYAIKIFFQTDTILVSTHGNDYLIELATNFEENWKGYLKRLSLENRSRNPALIDAISD